MCIPCQRRGSAGSTSPTGDKPTIWPWALGQSHQCLDLGVQRHVGASLRGALRRHGRDARPGVHADRPAEPFFAALLGWLGVALTGSDTSSNALFGGLQKITAQGLVRASLLPATVTETGAVVLM